MQRYSVFHETMYFCKIFIYFCLFEVKKINPKRRVKFLNSTQKQMHDVKIALKQYKTPMKLQLL